MPSLFDLVALALDQMEQQGPAALEALCREHPAQAEKLRSRVGRLGALGLAGAPPADELPERVGPFRPLLRLGGGGMGVVFVAEQEGLQRRVALKLVRPGALAFAGARERFQREVEVLARLQHPSIVKVHAGGEEQGLPFLAMELVRGATLEEALAELGADGAAPEAAGLMGRDLLAAVETVVARRDARLAAGAGASAEPIRPVPGPASRGSAPPGSTPRSPVARTASSAAELPPLFAGNWVVAAVRLAVQLAEALQHAHDQGVLHRDLKPSNVMLTPEGRVLLLDFGLASVEGGTRLTQSGQALGSPAYMSPEQLGAQAGAVGVRSDVYGVGITLYELLTLRQPFATESVPSTTRLVLAAAAPPPRSANPAVSRDLETVVQAAMEKDAARRFASAADLGRDLRNVLELRPIEVRPPSPARRLVRWTQRHPALAAACALVLLLLVAGALGWDLMRRRSLDAISAARDQSERHFQAALEAVGHVLRDVATEELEDVPRMQRARLVALDRALELFLRLEADRPDDLLVLTEGAHLHLSRGEVLRDLGRPAEALPEFEHAIALRRRLLGGAGNADDAPPAAAIVALAEVLGQAGKTHFALGDTARALTVLQETTALYRQACEATAQRPDLRQGLAHALANQAESQRELGQFADARAALDEALPHAEAARQAAPHDASALWTEGRVCADLGAWELVAGSGNAALAWVRRALLCCEAAQAAAPERRFYAYDVADAWRQVADVLSELGRIDEALDAVAAGLALVDGLLVDYPDVARYRTTRRRLIETRGVLAGGSGDYAAARADFSEVVAELDALCAAQPQRRDHAGDSVQALSNLASALIDERRDLDTALALLDRAEERLALALDVPHPPNWLSEVAPMVSYNRGRALCFQQRGSEARVVIEAFEQAAGADPMRLRYAADLWNELVLSLRRAAATGAAPDAAAEAHARPRMYALLHAALDAGYADRGELSSTPSLDDFRAEPEFVALMDRLRPDG